MLQSAAKDLSAEQVEYFDANNRRLMVSSSALLRGGGLYRRKVGLIVYDRQRRVYVCRHSEKSTPSVLRTDKEKAEVSMLWDLACVGFVRAFASSDEAIYSFVSQQFGEGIEGIRPHCEWIDHENFHNVSLYALGPMHPLPTMGSSQRLVSGQFMSKQELLALHDYAEDLCSSLLSWALRSQMLWRS